MNDRFKDKVIIVTGAGNGIGAAAEGAFTAKAPLSCSTDGASSNWPKSVQS